MSSQSQALEGKTAVVTGAGGDIGRATSLLLAQRGARVLVVDVDEVALLAVVDAVTAAGGEAAGWTADVTSEADVEAYANEGQRFGGGHIDLFFNNAGIEGRSGPLVAMEVADFDRVFAVNVRGVFLGLKHVLPRMSEGGAVVNTSSVGGLRGSPGLAAYVASKHAVLGLTKTAALEMADRRIRVSAVCPGAVQGRMIRSLDDQRGQAAGGSKASSRPFGRYASPEEVAAAAVFLLGPDAAFVSGTSLVVDGNQTAR